MCLSIKWLKENYKRVKSFQELIPKDFPLQHLCKLDVEAKIGLIQEGLTSTFWLENYSIKQEVFDTWDCLPLFGAKFPYFIKDNLILFQGDKRVRVFYKAETNPKFTIVDAYNFVQEITTKEDNYKIGFLVNDYGELTIRYFNLVLKFPVDIEKHFNDDFKPFADDMLISLAERHKGLYILHGEPGTGKTTFIKYLAKTVRRNFIFIPAGMTSALATPDILNILMDHQDSVIVLEDCSKELISRDNNYSPDSVANLLNMSDGILADSLNMTFIATVNMNLNKIDDAILRAGRCLGEYKFDSLTVDKCKELGFDVKEPHTIAQLYNGKNMKQLNERKQIGFNKN